MRKKKRSEDQGDVTDVNENVYTLSPGQVTNEGACFTRNGYKNFRIVMPTISCRCIYVTFYLLYSSSNRHHKDDHPKDVALFDRIRQTINCRLVVTDVMRV